MTMQPMSRRVNETKRQGVDESIPYALDTSPWPGSARNSASVKVYSYVAGVYTDVTATNCPAGATAVGTTISFTVTALTAGIAYRYEVKWTNEDGGVFECWGEIHGER